MIRQTAAPVELNKSVVVQSQKCVGLFQGDRNQQSPPRRLASYAHVMPEVPSVASILDSGDYG